jgi:hypothetical protein
METLDEEKCPNCGGMMRLVGSESTAQPRYRRPHLRMRRSLCRGRHIKLACKENQSSNWPAKKTSLPKRPLHRGPQGTVEAVPA